MPFIFLLFFFLLEVQGDIEPSILSSMDSYFKAAVCDLDKLLDDFELNTGENTTIRFLWPQGMSMINQYFNYSLINHHILIFASMYIIIVYYLLVLPLKNNVARLMGHLIDAFML